MALMIGCIWHGLDALQGTRAKPGNHLIVDKIHARRNEHVCENVTIAPVSPTYACTITAHTVVKPSYRPYTYLPRSEIRLFLRELFEMQFVKVT